MDDMHVESSVASPGVGMIACAEPVCCTCADLVFIQNGMLQPWLDEKGLGDTTQVRFVWG